MHSVQFLERRSQGTQDYFRKRVFFFFFVCSPDMWKRKREREKRGCDEFQIDTIIRGCEKKEKEIEARLKARCNARTIIIDN